MVLIERASVIHAKARVFEQQSLGSLFREANCSDETASPVVVLSYDLWRNSFGADPAIVGRSMKELRASFLEVVLALSF